VTALLDGLAPGDAIGAWSVHVIRVIESQIGVDLLKDEQVLTIWIARKGGQKVPPRQTERYAIFYGYPSSAQQEASRDIERILDEIEKRIRRTESAAPVPAGL
jgi:hypothetical protein